MTGTDDHHICLTHRSVGRDRLCSRAVCDIAVAVAANADIRLLTVADEALERTESRAVLADFSGRLVGHDLLVGTGLEELPDPQAAGVTGSLSSGQSVVRTDHFVS